MPISPAGAAGGIAGRAGAIAPLPAPRFLAAIIAIILALVLAATFYLWHSKLGRQFHAIRDSEHVAMASGIDVKRTKVWALAISAFYAGIAGGVYTLFQSYVHPDGLGVSMLVLVLSMVVVGGW